MHRNIRQPDLMHVLLGAFEPFGGHAANPTMQMAEALLADPPDGLTLSAVVLPVTWEGTWPALLRAVQAQRPQAVLLTGLAAGRPTLAVERVALNLEDAAMPDNAGECRVDQPILAGAPAAYFATLPVRAMCAAAAQAAAAELSLTAGTFLCNHALYRLLHHAATEQPHLRCGLIHVPLPEAATLRMQHIVAGVRAALAVLPGAPQAPA